MIRISIFFSLLIYLFSQPILAQSEPSDFFNFNKSLRIDFILTGTKSSQTAGLVNLIEEPHWSGNEKSLVWPMDYGTYRLDVYSENGQLIFRNGFSTLFEEWQTTALTRKGPVSFEQSINIPFPKNKIKVELRLRKKDGFELLSAWNINPQKEFFIKKNPIYKAQRILGKGEPSNSLDLVFIAEGYLVSDSIKAIEDTKRFAKYLLSQKPFNKYKSGINIWLVHPESMEPGTTEPRKEIYKNTALNSHFNSLNLSRYLTITEYFKMKDVAASAPYDYALIMVNTKRYGGGGIFNHFSVFAADSDWGEEVFVHEFGHHFGGLADEYYDSEVSYEDMLDTKKEPWNPNITTLVAFDGKWKDLISKGTPVPTPRDNKYKGKTGVFEGGAYMSKGVYSPSMDCKMNTNTAEGFCVACQDAIEQMLKLYIK